MSSAKDQARQQPEEEEEEMDEMLDAEDAAEEIAEGEGDDIAMDSDNEEVELQNDSIAYFDLPPDSLFAIAQHPVRPSLVAVGGSAGPEDEAPGAGWLFDTAAAAPRPVLPPSYASDPAASATAGQTTQLPSLFALDGHSDSVNALCWTLPRGDVLVSGGLDGRLRAWKADLGGDGGGVAVSLLGEAREVDEINWLAPCPSPSHPDTIALGASDGSVWVYTVDAAAAAADALQIVQSYYLHTGACTAGAWTPDGQLLATVAEDSSLHVWDVWGAAAAQGLAGDGSGMTAVSLTGSDQRFEVEGGLYSVAVDPGAAFVAVGGAGGAIRVVSLPRLGAGAPAPGGQILASLRAQAESVETLAVAQTATAPPTTLLAAGSVDGSVAVFDATRRFAVRRHIAAAHDDQSVVRLDFVPRSWLLTSCGMDGVVRRWDLRAAGAGAHAGLVKEWRGHRGGGDGGGVLGFVQGQTGERIVTAGDDGLALVFEA